MTIFNLIKPEDYPLYITLPSCALLLLYMFFTSYKKESPYVSAIFFLGSIVFVHLDLATYYVSSKWTNAFISFWNLEHLPTIIAFFVKISSFIILVLVPFLVWSIPMVLLDENLSETIKESDKDKFKKTFAILVVGFIVNVTFASIIYK